MEILETKGRKMNKIKREERENLHTFSDTTVWKANITYLHSLQKEKTMEYQIKFFILLK